MSWKYFDRSSSAADNIERFNLKNGFTLLEVVLALAIFSIIISALYSTFFLSERAIRSMEGSTLRLHELRMALNVMERELEAVPKGSISRDVPAFIVKDRDFFGKQATELHFRTFSAPSAGATGVSYFVEEKEDGQIDLIKKLTAMNAKEGMEAPVLEDIESFAVEVKERGGWLTVWDRSDTPSELKITIAAKLGDRSIRLSRIVKPMIGRKI